MALITFIARVKDGLVLAEDAGDSRDAVQAEGVSQARHQAKEIMQQLSRLPLIPWFVDLSDVLRFYCMIQKGIAYMALFHHNCTAAESFSFLADVSLSFQAELKRASIAADCVDSATHLESIVAPGSFSKFGEEIARLRSNPFHDALDTQEEKMVRPMRMSIDDILCTRRLDDLLEQAEAHMRRMRPKLAFQRPMSRRRALTLACQNMLICPRRRSAD
jgi:hypothetical protein